MKDFLNQLSALAVQCQNNYDRVMGQNNGEIKDIDTEYTNIRRDALELLAKAKRELSSADLEIFKTTIMAFFCKHCGCHLDLAILASYTPSVLTDDDFDFIKQNSPLARWS